MAIESVIKKNYCFTIVQKWYSNSNEVLSVQDIASIVLSWIIPVWNNIELDSKPSNYSISPILENKTLHTFLSNKDIKKKIKKYTREGLEEFLKHSIVETDANLCVICSNCVHFIDCVEDGFVSFKDSKNLYDNILKIGTSDVEKFVYGTESFEQEDLPMSLNNDSDQDNLEIDTESENHEEEAESGADYIKLLIQINNDIKEQCKTKEKFYFWEYKLGQPQFEVLRASLKKVLKPSVSVVRKYAFVLALYVAEWYKRVSNTSEGDEWFKEFGLPNGYTNTIWEQLETVNSFLKGLHYKATENNIRHTTSLCVLGGLPINYIKSNNLFDAFITSVYELSKEDVIDEEEAFEDLSAIFRNSAISQSLRNEDGSLHVFTKKLIEYLQEDSEEEAIKKLPFNEKDIYVEPVKSFLSQLRDGYKEKVRADFLSPNWLMYLCADEEDSENSLVAEAKFELNIGHKTNNCVIPQNVLSKWQGFESDLSQFKLYLRVIDNNDTCIAEDMRLFINRGGGSREYVSLGTPSLEVDIELSSFKEVVLSLCSKECETIIGCPYRIGDARQFYKTANSYEWSSRKEHCNDSAVLYDRFVCDIDNWQEDGLVIKSINSLKYSNSYYNWCVLDKTICLRYFENQNETIVFSPSKGKIELHFIHKLDSNVRLTDNKAVYTRYSEEESEMMVPVICGLPKSGFSGIFSVWVSDNNLGKTIKKKLSGEEFRVEYKDDGERLYSVWHENQRLSQGIKKIRVSHIESEYSPWESYVYYFPKESPINRIESSVIRFDAEKVKVPVISNEGVIWEDLEGSDYIDCQLDDNLDTIPFVIDNLNLEIYRGKRFVQLYFPDNTSKDFNEKKLAKIPIITKNQFSIRISDEYGVRRHKMDDLVLLNTYDYSFDEFVSIKRIIEKKNLKYYLFEHKRVSERPDNFIDISPSKSHEYDFYYWSVDRDTNPIKLTLDVIDGKYVIPVDCLEGAKKGIIFQSLKEHISPNYLYPIYPNQLRTPSLNAVNMELCIRCFEVAVDHKCYFVQFYPLKRLFIAEFFQDAIPKKLARFALQIIEKHSHNPSIYKELHRFAEEHLFDWIMIPIRYWKSLCGQNHDKRDKVIELFESMPWVSSREEQRQLKEILDYFWALDDTDAFRKFRRSDKLENIFLQTIRGDEKDFSIFDIAHDRGKKRVLSDKNEIIKFLESLRSNQRTFGLLNKFINEKIIRI